MSEIHDQAFEVDVHCKNVILSMESIFKTCTSDENAKEVTEYFRSRIRTLILASAAMALSRMEPPQRPEIYAAYLETLFVQCFEDFKSINDEYNRSQEAH